MKSIKSFLTLIIYSTLVTAHADIIGLYQGDNGAHLDFSVLTYTRGITIDARLDPSIDSRVSALQSTTITADQYRELFESDKTIEEMELASVFESRASAFTENGLRTVVVTESFKTERGAILKEKKLVITIEDSEVKKIALKTRVRRSILGVIPAWVTTAFKQSSDISKVEDGLLLRDDGHDLCRVVSESGIAQGAQGGNYQELRAVCNQY